ncbi:hypothetical protein [Paraburkholderia sp. HP33-1]|uniref:hypothetical protein n=1 Tax=Paraburkholderia sp. HP33-1 TaxID=2883243 RepID=UPI001F17037C|nr:hypothetical protein [Paraburkholderia sp. HP33-1]
MPNLDDAAIGRIVQILDGWSGKLTWQLLIDAIQHRSKQRYTRQALYSHERIRQAYGGRKKALSTDKPAMGVFDGPPELKIALDEVARLTAANERLENENNRLLEQFVRWTYNASKKNLTEELLNRPLPPVDRERSDAPRRGGRAQPVKRG